MEDERDVISLLCAIFVANHGAGEAAGEEKCFSLVSNCLCVISGYHLRGLIYGNIDVQWLLIRI